MGGDHDFEVNHIQAQIFQLTPPMWAATSVCLKVVFSKHISTHATHVGGDPCGHIYGVWHFISTHATHVGGDIPR